jgi:putative ABC transport system substrate-binding protein
LHSAETWRWSRNKQQATSSIPIVMATSGHPVHQGLVASLAQPGGNVTGVTFLSSDLVAKRLGLLMQLRPTISSVDILWNPEHADEDLKNTLAAAADFRVELRSLEVRSQADLNVASDTLRAGDTNGLIVVRLV